MQQPAHPLVPMPQIPPANITTEQIQKYLDENKQLILAILDNQNLGKLAECAQYQAQLQKNLLFLAAIADAQPQHPTARLQMTPHGLIQQGAHYMQPAPIFPPRPSCNPQQLQDQQQQQQQPRQQPQLLPFQGHMGMRPGVMNGMASHGGSSDLPPGSSMGVFPRGGPTPGASVDGRGSKQDTGGTVPESAAADGNKSSAIEHGSRNGEPTHLKRSEDTKAA